MDRIFIDTNIFIDLFLKREEFFEASERIVRNYIAGSVCVSALTIANACYICKVKDKKVMKEFAKNFEVVELTNKILDDAYKAATPDLEDGIQVASCMEVSNIFVTRNKKDFANYNEVLIICTPEEFLSKIADPADFSE